MFNNRLFQKIHKVFRQNLLKENYINTTREIFAVLIWMMSTYMFYLILKYTFPSLIDLFANNLVVVVSSYFIVDGLIYSLLYRNLHSLSQQISARKVDHIILLPTSFQNYTSFRNIQLSSFVQIPIALILVFVFYKPSVIESFFWFVSLIIGFVIAYFFWYLLSLIAFWLDVGEKSSLFFEELSIVGMFPLQPFLSLKVAWLFFPFLAIASFSSYGLINHQPFIPIIQQVCLLVVLFALCKTVEFHGIKKYRS